MEHKQKVLATSSFEGEGSCTASGMMIDRFTNLPDGVAHHILSFLYVRDLTSFSSVSKKCRQLYLSAPSLIFDRFLQKHINEATCEVRLRLLNSLDRFLLRRGDNKIESFRLMWEGHSLEVDDETPCFCVNELFRIMTLVQNAVRCNVEVLHVEIYMHDFEDVEATFLLCVFPCTSLRSLLVDMNCGIVKAPSLGFSSNLECVVLRNVAIEDEAFFKWISLSCKYIKELHLWDIRKIRKIIIESSSLEKFEFLDAYYDTHHLSVSGPKLEDITIDWRCFKLSKVSLDICAPNLKSLCWKGNVISHANLGKLEFLKEASVCMAPEVDDSNNLLEVFCSLNRVQELVLNAVTVKALFRGGSMRAQLDNLYYLHMNTGSFSDEFVPAVVSLLRGMPNLCTLYIQYRPNYFDPKSDASQESGFDIEYWKLQNLACVHQLEEVVIELSDGSNGIEFARYILEHAEAMEDMTIIYLPGQSDIIQKLNESEMMSQATVTFKEKQAR